MCNCLLIIYLLFESLSHNYDLPIANISTQADIINYWNKELSKLNKDSIINNIY